METIQSVLSQKDVDVEIIVVDDGSTDQTEQLVSKITDNRLRYLKTKNSERGAARNLGVKHANGVFINYFDSDDLYYPCLQLVRNFIIDNHFPTVVYGDIHILMMDGKVNENVALPFSSFKENILFNNFLACGSVFINREVALAFPFSVDRSLSGSEDWELWLRLYAEFDFVRVPVAIFKQRHHPNRGLLTADAIQVTSRETLFAQLIEQHRRSLKKRFTDEEINLLKADRMTLIALVQILEGKRKLAFQYWSKSFTLSPRVLKRRRFLAVAKKLMLM
jgi:glycosyltransferase involved in cell wall biosynthesis